MVASHAPQHQTLKRIAELVWTLLTSLADCAAQLCSADSGAGRLLAFAF